MGTRSDVGIALKKSLWDKVKDRPEFAWVIKEESFPAAAYATGQSACERHEEEDGILFVFRDIKWYVGCDKEIDALYDLLRECSDGLCDGPGMGEGDYLVVAACQEHPNSEEGIEGDWYDNPWCLHKVVTVELSYD